MDIATFDRRGHDRWERARALHFRVKREGLGGLTFDEVEELVGLQRQVVSDFAFARTHFGDVGITERLRSLAFEGHQLLTPPESVWWKRLLDFYGTTYPRRFREHRSALAVAVGLFVGFTILGFAVGTATPEFAAVWVGPEGVDQLQRGEIWTDGVHLIPPSVLSATIFTNNISVGLMCWASGALFGVGTLFVLGSNGAMFGALLALALQTGMLDRLFAFIAGHGPLELFLIVACAAAGFVLAEGLVRPTDLPRSVRFGRAGRDSVQLMLGTVPWFVLLGIVEGFLSPDMEIETATKAVLGCLVLSSFVVYVSLAGRASEAAMPEVP